MTRQYVIDNRPSPIDFSKDDYTRRILQNAKNLLMLRMGEVPYDRLRGFDPALFDLPLPRLREELLPELDRVMLWEPHAEVVDADAEIDEETGNIIITCTLELNE